MAGKVAIITGAAQGLGKAFSEALLKIGARVSYSILTIVVYPSRLILDRAVLLSPIALFPS